MIWRPLVVLLLAVGIVAVWIVRSPAETPARFAMPAGKTYVSECGACHAAFAPGLLPARSWRKMMTELDKHFGEDASLEEPQYFAILKELETLAADGGYADMRMGRISSAIPAASAPQRVTETPFFRHTHDEIPEAVWKRKSIATRLNCLACHPEANQGRFDEREMRVPRE